MSRSFSEHLSTEADTEAVVPPAVRPSTFRRSAGHSVSSSRHGKNKGSGQVSVHMWETNEVICIYIYITDYVYTMYITLAPD